MRPPATANERERRLVEYLTKAHKGQLAEFKLSRLNRIANFRKILMELLNNMIEARAEDLAAGMLMEHAQPRPKKRERNRFHERLPIPPKKAKLPVWLRDSYAKRRG